MHETHEDVYLPVILLQFSCCHSVVWFTGEGRPSRVHRVARLRLSEDEIYIRGVTLLGNRIYVVCLMSNVITVFTSHRPFPHLQDIVVDGLCSPVDVAACVNAGCLYVADPGSRSVWRISVDSGAVVQWLTDMGASTVSVTSEDSVVLLVLVDVPLHVDKVCRDEVHVYSPEAMREAVINLSPDINPQSVVMTTRKTLIVSHDDRWDGEMDRVCEVDMTGRVLKSFGSTRGSGNGQLYSPAGVSLDDEERVIVADTGKNRVLLLNKQLTSARVLMTWQSDDDASEPWSLHYDSHTGSLLVGLSSGHVDIYKLK